MKYVRASAPKESDAQIAQKIGINASTMSRWRSGAIDPKPRQVTAFARAYSRNPLEALFAAGYLDEESLGLPVVAPTGLSHVSTVNLIEEVASRIESMGYFANWLESLHGGTRDLATLGEGVVRELHPFRAPSETRIEPFLDVAGDRLITRDIDGDTAYGVAAEEE